MILKVQCLSRFIEAVKMKIIYLMLIVLCCVALALSNPHGNRHEQNGGRNGGGMFILFKVTL